MAIYKHIDQLWKKPRESLGELWTGRLIKWRDEPVTIRIDKPTRLSRARSLGYKAKPGIIVVRQRVNRGGRQRPDIKHGRRSKHARQRKILSMNYRQVAEQRAASKFPNLEVLNSYWVAKDGSCYWYEVILVDKNHPVIQSDKNLSWMAGKKNTRRVFRGLTSAARKSRGLRRKGIGAEKVR